MTTHAEPPDQAEPEPESSTVPALEAAIAKHPFTCGLTPAHLRLLADNAMVTFWRSGEVIFREGDPANRFYLIRSGQVALESSRRDEAPVLLQHVGAGDVLGWSWLFPPYEWHFDARAVEPTEAIFFYGTRLREKSEQSPELGYELMKRMVSVIIQRLQATRRQLLGAKLAGE